MTAVPLAEAPAAAVRASLVLRVTLVAALALAPLEGYLLAVNGNLSKLAPALFLASWVLHRLSGGRPLGVSHPVVWCAVSLLPLVLLSAAVNWDNPFSLAYTVRWVPFLVLVVALVDVLTHDVDPWTALHALLAGAVASAAGAVFSFAVLGSPRATGPLDDPNDLAYVLTAALPIALASLHRTRSALVRCLLVVGLLLLVFGAAATLSRGGLIAATAVLLWGLVRGLVRLRALALGAAVLVVVAVPVLVSVADQVGQALGQKQYIAQTNINTRELRWLAAARMLGDDPLLGVGPGGFRAGYVEYSRLAELDYLDPVAHEMYLEVGAELGAPALLLFLGMIVAAFAASEAAVRRARAPSADGDDLLRLAGLAVQGSLIALCLSSIFLSQQYYMPLWAGVSIAAALQRRTERS